MAALVRQVVEVAATSVDFMAAAIILAGAVEALAGAWQSLWQRPRQAGTRKGVWLGFSMWLLLGLEFELAADILRTAISPTWTDIGQLAAIATIRTGLNFFLERDLKHIAAD